MKERVLRELDDALVYYQSLGWCPSTGKYLDDMKALSTVMRKVDKNKVTMLDGFMKDDELRAFMIIHSVFNIDARTDGEFVEQYMASRLLIQEDQVERLFKRRLPDDLAKMLVPFEVELIPFEVECYRVEFGCGKDPETGRYQYDPIRLVDTTLDVEEKDTVPIEEFISQFEDVYL